MQFFQLNFYESQVEQLRKSITKDKNLKKVLLTFLLHFYDLKYQNFTKKRLSNQKSGMVFEVTLILN